MTRGQREEPTSGTAAESKRLPSINKTRFGKQHFVVFLPCNGSFTPVFTIHPLLTQRPLVA